MTDAWLLKQPIYMIKIQPITGSSQHDLITTCALLHARSDRYSRRQPVKSNFLLEEAPSITGNERRRSKLTTGPRPL
jgi:hypothetical protein